MLNWRSFRFTREIVLRMGADAVLLNVSLILALAVRYFYLVAFETIENGFTYNQMFWAYVTFFSKRSWLLTAICLIVFLMSGFYTYSRAYQGRYKALMIFQAASLGYLIFSFFSYILGLMPQLPRGAVLLALFGLLIWRTWRISATSASTGLNSIVNMGKKEERKAES